METKKISLFMLYVSNLLVFLAFAASIYFMNAKLKIWFIFLVLLVISGFETLFFYRKNNKSYTPIAYGKASEVVLLSIGSSVALLGSVLLVLIVLL